MVDMDYREAVLDLSALPNCTACGRETKVDLEDRVPNLLVLASTVVNQLPDRRACLSLSAASPVVTIV